MNKFWIFAVLGLIACGGDDSAPHCDESGRACTWLGLPGSSGFNGDGKDRLETKMYWSMDMTFAADGTPWLIDWNNHMVRRVLPDQTVETVLGWTDPPLPGDGGAGETMPGGALGTEVQMNHPTDLAIDADGTVLVMAWHNHKLRRIDPVTKRVTIECGAGAGYRGDGGDAKTALFRQPKALTLGPNGERYIIDQQNWRIRVIDTAGIINTIAGTGMQGDNSTQGDGGPALDAKLYHPRDLEVGPDGDLYVADTDNSVIRAISKADGTIRTVAGTGELGLNEEEGLLATETILRRPFGIEFDGEGNLYISDTINSRIVRVAR